MPRSTKVVVEMDSKKRGKGGRRYAVITSEGKGMTRRFVAAYSATEAKDIVWGRVRDEYPRDKKKFLSRTIALALY